MKPIRVLRGMAICTAIGITAMVAAAGPATAPAEDLWRVYHDSFEGAKYIDLTHACAPLPVYAQPLRRGADGVLRR